MVIKRLLCINEDSKKVLYPRPGIQFRVSMRMRHTKWYKSQRKSSGMNFFVDKCRIVHSRIIVWLGSILLKFRFCSLISSLWLSIYIKLKSCLSVTPITCLGLLRSAYQLPNTINLSSSHFKFVTAR